MTITILTVGARPNQYIQTIIDDYEKRLPKHVRVSWVCIPHGFGDPLSSKHQEAEAILRKIPNNSYTIVLDEKGKQLDSPAHAQKLFGEAHQPVTYIIGGAYGVSDELLKRVDFVWSLSSLVFPHQLVRAILAEQIYRAYAIQSGHPYHHA